MRIEKLFSYPIKSTRGQRLEKASILRTGICGDRTIAVINKEFKIVTGRESPELIKVSSVFEGGILTMETPAEVVSLEVPMGYEFVKIKLFRNEVNGMPFGKKANDWISKYLGGDYRLVFLGKSFRPILSKRGGKSGEQVGYADSAPVHLISRKSLNELNSRLKHEVTERNFRPNFIIDGEVAYEEDHWKSVRINGLDFRVQERTQRCIFTTIDPKTGKRNENLQPLTTIAKMRLKSGLRPTFGINLIPMGEGEIAVNDGIEINPFNTSN